MMRNILIFDQRMHTKLTMTVIIQHANFMDCISGWRSHTQHTVEEFFTSLFATENKLKSKAFISQGVQESLHAWSSSATAPCLVIMLLQLLDVHSITSVPVRLCTILSYFSIFRYFSFYFNLNNEFKITAYLPFNPWNYNNLSNSKQIHKKFQINSTSPENIKVDQSSQECPILNLV